MNVRRATLPDAAAITAIYNEGIASRGATFETQLRSEAETSARVANALERHAWLVADDGEVAGWAAATPYSSRPCYDGVAEFSIYVGSTRRGQGVGRLLLTALLAAATEAGLHKLTSRIFTENVASRSLCAAVGFREVGVHLRHGQLEGRWHDVVTVEALLGPAR